MCTLSMTNFAAFILLSENTLNLEQFSLQMFWILNSLSFCRLVKSLKSGIMQ